MIKIRSLPSGKIVNVKSPFIFGGGEQAIQILDDPGKVALLELTFNQDSDIMQLAFYVDALRRMDCRTLTLSIPYFPGARQDRVCNPGEALSVKVYADIINAMNFERVLIFDPHSEVTPALINNVKVVNNHQFVTDVLWSDRTWKELHDKDQPGDATVFISPDAGSNKKIYDLAKRWKGAYPVVRADKLRELSTGKIIDCQVYAEDLTNKTCVIIDDICSKGGSFIGLAKKLKEKNAAKIFLIVSHFEGTANLSALKESGIDKVFTTNSKDWDTNDYNKANYITTFNVFNYLHENI